jgi:uncharacterized protein YjiS (DUF1127 family)
MTTVRLNHFVGANDISAVAYGMVQRIEAAAKQVRGTLSTWVSRAAERRQLEMLSDHLLKDIGITRAEVSLEINKYFWQR